MLRTSIDRSEQFLGLPCLFSHTSSLEEEILFIEFQMFGHCDLIVPIPGLKWFKINQFVCQLYWNRNQDGHVMRIIKERVIVFPKLNNP